MWQDELKHILNPAQIQAVAIVREEALKIKCTTAEDSRAMTSGNLMPLFIIERGVEWTKQECRTLLDHFGGTQEFRMAVAALLRVL